MAYFTCDAQAFDKLQIQLRSPYFRLETANIYHADRAKIWGTLREMGGADNDECMRLRNAVFNGWDIGGYNENPSLRTISGEGRPMRWTATSITPDLYAKVSSDEKTIRAEANATSHFL